jgi:tripartite-type tricarboxylate transporter receptor subunit TctC
VGGAVLALVDHGGLDGCEIAIDMMHVPFRGAIAVIADLLAGRIDMFIGAINSLLPLIKEGTNRDSPTEWINSKR